MGFQGAKPLSQKSQRQPFLTEHNLLSHERDHKGDTEGKRRA